MIQEDDLNILGITKEEWEKMNVFKLTTKYMLAKKQNDKIKMPEDVREKNSLNINAVYDQLKTAIITSRRDLTKEETPTEEVSGEIDFNKMMPKVNLPQGLRDVAQIKQSQLPTPKKFMDKGVIINPEALRLGLKIDELVIPADKKDGDVLVYTDLNRIALLQVVKV